VSCIRIRKDLWGTQLFSPYLREVTYGEVTGIVDLSQKNRRAGLSLFLALPHKVLRL
jgi:hypothetical protein